MKRIFDIELYKNDTRMDPALIEACLNAGWPQEIDGKEAKRKNGPLYCCGEYIVLEEWCRNVDDQSEKSNVEEVFEEFEDRLRGLSNQFEKILDEMEKSK